jgi:hypothetical protein
MRSIALALTALLLAACQPGPPPGEVAPEKTASAPQASAPPSVRPETVVPPVAKLPSSDFPPGPLYFCETASGKAAIEYEARVEQLCRRHPEMSPCQYERNACRSKGGRVYTAKGEEVTVAVEAEYDRIVRRVTFQGDSGGKGKK